MLKTIINRLVLSALAFFSLIPTSGAAEKISVFVSILPQRYFVEQIGKNLVDIRVMVEPGANPATYEPKPAQMAAISKARIFFSIGVPFETTWLGRIASSNPGMAVVYTDHGIRKMPVSGHDHPGENKEDNSGEPGHEILDPHIWLSPPLVMLQARHILTALQHADPAHRQDYESNYRAFINMLTDLDLELGNIFAGKQGLRFMVFHPAWGYFADAYGLRQVPIEIEGKEPKPSQLKTLIDLAREHQIKVLFVQPQFSSRSAGQVAREIKGKVAFVDPLAVNWRENLHEAANNFREALK